MNKIDKLIITNLPSFYKVNLYNEIAKHKKVFVIYTGDTANERNKDFFSREVHFPFVFLVRNKLCRLLQVVGLVCKYSHEELIIGGWDSLPMWCAAIFSSKKKNAVVVESSYLESTTKGVKGFAKKVFMSRISKVYASGISQRKITDALGFKGQTVITKGVGVFNYIPQPAFERREKVVNFLYVGRFVECKNLKFLIETFKELPSYQLYLAGFGVQEDELKRMAGSNIHFLGAVNNKDLPSLYQKMDVFVLPSISEPWGLVVEEALNNGLPVLVSNRVGCAEEIVREGENGLVFRYNSKEDLKDKVKRISDIELYNNMRLNISRLDFAKIEKKQVDCYL